MTFTGFAGSASRPIGDALSGVVRVRTNAAARASRIGSFMDPPRREVSNRCYTGATQEEERGRRKPCGSMTEGRREAPDLLAPQRGISERVQCALAGAGALQPPLSGT